MMWCVGTFVLSNLTKVSSPWTRMETLACTMSALATRLYLPPSLCTGGSTTNHLCLPGWRTFRIYERSTLLSSSLPTYRRLSISPRACSAYYGLYGDISRDIAFFYRISQRCLIRFLASTRPWFKHASETRPYPRRSCSCTRAISTSFSQQTSSAYATCTSTCSVSQYYRTVSPGLDVLRRWRQALVHYRLARATSRPSNRVIGERQSMALQALAAFPLDNESRMSSPTPNFLRRMRTLARHAFEAGRTLC